MQSFSFGIFKMIFNHVSCIFLNAFGILRIVIENVQSGGSIMAKNYSNNNMNHTQSNAQSNTQSNTQNNSQNTQNARNAKNTQNGQNHAE